MPTSSNHFKLTILEPSKNPRFMIGAIVGGVTLLLVLGWLLVLFTNALRPTALDGMRLRDLLILTTPRTSLEIPPVLFRNFVIALFTVLIIHELVHGLFYWLFSGKRPKFGIWGLFVYVAAPTGVYFPRNQFVAVVLAPLVLLTAVGLSLIVIAPIPWVPFLLFFVAINAAGAAGDLIMVVQLMSFSARTVIEDSDVGVIIYGPRETKWTVRAG